MKRVFPAEWAPQQAVMLTWPHDNTDWSPQLDAVERVYFNIAKAILDDQNLIISCEDKERLAQVSSELSGHARQTGHQLSCFHVEADDTWARDHGPISVYENDQLTLLDFTFNAWGDKFSSSKDDLITQRLHTQNAFPNTKIQKIDMILEGGSIESDGKGTLLTTEKCLLTDSRNAELSRHEIEAQLKLHLGIERVLWLKHGYLAGDDTDAHIDTLARICNEETICYVACNNPDDEHFEELKRMEEELRAFNTTEGKPYKLIPLPMADAIYHEGENGSERLPATYANFLITNHSILLPVYNVEQDTLAIQTLQEAFPGRKVVPIDCCPLIIEHGSLHCVTMQIPKTDSEAT